MKLQEFRSMIIVLVVSGVILLVMCCLDWTYNRGVKRGRFLAEKSIIPEVHSPLSTNSLYTMVMSLHAKPLTPALVPFKELPVLARHLLEDNNVSSVLVTRGSKESNLRVAFETSKHPTIEQFQYNDDIERKGLDR